VSLACGGGTAGREAVQEDTTLSALAARLQPEMERASGIVARRPLILARTSRTALERFLAAQLEEELPPARAKALVRVYARLGLVPDTLHLEKLLHSLYMEQVVGYYDPASDTLFVVEGEAPDQIGAVVAHEIVHALQDQVMDIDSVVRAVRGNNDRSTAIHAALEGHATFAMLEWQLQQMTGQAVDLTQLPDLAGMIGGDALASGSAMPVLTSAPPLIRESLLFPYVGGVSYVQALWRGAAVRHPPLGPDLPESTEQILHPGRRLRGAPDRPLTVSFPETPPAGWREVTSDDLGEFETRLFLTAWLGDSRLAEAAAAGWGGDRYRLLEGPEGREVWVWATAWDDAAEAREFKSAVRKAYAARYAASTGRRVVDVAGGVTEGRPTVRIVDRPARVPERAFASALEFRITPAPVLSGAAPVLPGAAPRVTSRPAPR